ncbi:MULTISPECIES: hypothetical protein [unclassified Synechococcus]|uniref:hypothetical protein n=1 Tax=unclassified Synechococcus TaxID=2626047 RepID=UPI0016874F5A|nr:MULTISPECIES: hypothetical protein [unclassified Synechococcus]MBD2719507.1 hypothetical protein [Synechococcus sp. FACHB-909]
MLLDWATVPLVNAAMLDAQNLSAVLAAMVDAGSPEKRRKAERELEAMVVELIDAKVLRSLCGHRSLDELAAVAMESRHGLTPAARVVLDRFRYRLAHVAMRNREWVLAEALLNVVLAGEGDLTRARLFLAVCRGRDLGRIPENDLVEILDCHRAEQAECRQRPPLDVLIQDPTTSLLELLLLSQGSPSDLHNLLYDPKARHGTTGLTLCIHSGVRNSMKVELSEWLAEAHLEEYRQEGWLLVDSTVALPGEHGRGSRLREAGGNIKAQILIGVAQVLGQAAPAPMLATTVQDRFLLWDDERLIRPEASQPQWIRVSSAELADHPGRRVITRSTGTRGEVLWWLKPPYAVVLRDASNVLRQAAGSSQ